MPGFGRGDGNHLDRENSRKSLERGKMLLIYLTFLGSDLVST